MQADFYERKAEQFLKGKGYKILEKNFRTRLGEVDIIGKDKKTVAFIEVKARSANYLVSPEEAITPSKRKRLISAAKMYMRNYTSGNWRFDVVSIVSGRDWMMYKLIKDAFEVDEGLSE
jgi:putative endonuclease